MLCTLGIFLELWDDGSGFEFLGMMMAPDV